MGIDRQSVVLVRKRGTNRISCSRFLAVFAILNFVCGLGKSRGGEIGPDIIAAEITAVSDYVSVGDFAGITMTITSCNAGDEVADWYPLPSNRHPVIAQNMYRLMDGQLKQIGQAWVKHGFAALQNPTCYLDCIPSHPNALGVHCSDPYQSSLNRGPELGRRSEINPVTGFFDGPTANRHVGHIHTSLSHALQVKHSDLAIPGARYFVEVQYVGADDALAGNGNNNVSYREQFMSGTPGNWNFANTGGTMRRTPAIYAWPGAAWSVVDSWPEDGRIIVSYKVTDFGGGQWRYDYAVYNMNSDRGIGSFSVPVGVTKVGSMDFYGVLSHEEDLEVTNDPWETEVRQGNATWSTLAYPSVRANPIRWGTMYNFWLFSDSPPVPSYVTLGRFKPGTLPLLRALVMAPSAGDCNRNGRSDDLDIAVGFSRDLDEDGLPDECEVCGHSMACGEQDLCAVHSCVDGWCAHTPLTYGDTNQDGLVRLNDIECAVNGFGRYSLCPKADVYGCDTDGGVDMRDVLAIIEAFEGSDACCEP
ncbi:MAG: hypothetical protein AABZ47_15100 [Planctomycetota bacterium]